MPPERGPARLRTGQAALLGLLHGPAELLPISSSGHVALLPWLAGWEYAELEPELRKAFEVALHAGTAAALLIALRGEVGAAARKLDGRRGLALALSALPPALAGLALEGPIERRLGTPATIAAGLAAGSVAMAAADRHGPAGRGRHHEDLGWLDGLALGLAQAGALMPGVSRNGATLTAARLRGFGRAEAATLSRQVALPVIVGASVLKGGRLISRGLPAHARRPFAVGVAASWLSTLGAARLVRRAGGADGRSLVPYAAYRIALAALVGRRLWKDRSPGTVGPATP